MAITESRMAQLIGPYADLNKSNMLVGEMAVPSDHVPVVRNGVNSWEDLLTSQSAGEIIALSETMEQQIADFEQLEIDKVGINDSTATLTQAYSGSKTQGLIDEVNTNLGLTNNNLDDNSNLVTSQFITKLTNGNITKIKLIGDSTVEGIGAIGHQNPTPAGNPIIFDNGAGTVFHEAQYDDLTWANLFRNYISENYSSIQFVNAGIGGKSAKWANANKQYWIGSEDVVFVQLGVNDRWDCATLAEFKTNLSEFLAYTKQHCNLMIVLSANPGTADYLINGTLNPQYNFSTGDMDRMITTICKEQKYPNFSQYKDMLNYCNMAHVKIDDLINLSSAHANNAGYNFMWQNTQQKLGFIDNYNNWKTPNTLGQAVITFPVDTIDGNSVISAFPNYKISYTSVPTIKATYFPSGKAGLLETNKLIPSAGYMYQKYTFYDSGETFIRIWLSTGLWGSWNTEGVKILGNNAVVSTSSITLYPVDNISFCLITNANSDIGNFPESLAGTLATYNIKNSAFSYQEYTIYQTNKTYKRYYTGTAWGVWQKISAI